MDFWSAFVSQALLPHPITSHLLGLLVAATLKLLPQHAAAERMCYNRLEVVSHLRK